MNALLQLIDKGGPAVIAIMVLSVLLYWRCFALLLALRRMRVRVLGFGFRVSRFGAWVSSFGFRVSGRGLRIGEPETRNAKLETSTARRYQDEIRATFRHQRMALGAMIAAAPLLGLLGTVSGMTKTFDTLAQKAGEKSMEGLARGISEVLVATESGLLVALPALGLVYLAQREANACIDALNPPRFAGDPARPRKGGGS